MEAILSNYLSFGDLIVVHMCGKVKELQLMKTQEYLGLTITDNGQGRAFVKKVNSDQQVVEDNIKPGYHIAAINNDSTIGLRHYEVAKAIREVPQGSNFTMRLIEPKHSDKYLPSIREGCNPASPGGANLPTPLRLTPIPPDFQNHGRYLSEFDYNPLDNDACGEDEFTNSSIPIDRLLSKRGQATTNESHALNKIAFEPDSPLSNTTANNIHDNTYKLTIENINSILESFLGINDNLLAIQIYRLARENKESYDQFLIAMKASELNDFNFDDEMKNYLWTCATNSALVK